MWKRLRTWIPILQVVLADGVLAWAKLGAGQAYDYYARAIRDLIYHLNFPLAVMWIVMALPFRRLSDRIASMRGPLATALLILLGVAMTVSVAAFWYLVVLEAEKRTSGLSIIRPSNRLGAVVSLGALFCFGAGALWYAYVASRPLWYVARRGALLTGFFPTIWGCIFLSIAVQDFLMLLNRERIQRNRGDAHPEQT